MSEPAKTEAETQESTVLLAELLRDKSPLKLVTGTQTSQGLSFELHPGAIVAHPGSAVVFVCG
jgi:hypothetical protein